MFRGACAFMQSHLIAFAAYILDEGSDLQGL